MVDIANRHRTIARKSGPAMRSGSRARGRTATSGRAEPLKHGTANGPAISDESQWALPEVPLRLYRFDESTLVDLVKAGVPSSFVGTLTERMAMGKEKFYGMLGLARPTLDRKIRARQILNHDESERLIGIARLIGQAEGMVQESGSPKEFDAARWVSAWLDRPLPALGGKRPSEFMDTGIGRALVSDILKQQQSAAYA
jgi:putative toxin-antitoxin system antitoxin component (TIGR02293 family)